MRARTAMVDDDDDDDDAINARSETVDGKATESEDATRSETVKQIAEPTHQWKKSCMSNMAAYAHANQICLPAWTLVGLPAYTPPPTCPPARSPACPPTLATGWLAGRLLAGGQAGLAGFLGT